MARHTGGWVKFWRKAALGDINSNYTRGGLFGALIAMANIQESTVDWMGSPRKLTRGQICTSYQELAELGGVDRKTVTKYMTYFVMRETLKVETSPQGVIITFLNYEQYAGVDASGPLPPPCPMDNGMDNAMDNGVPHNEEVKKKRTKGTVVQGTPGLVVTTVDLLDIIPIQTKERWTTLYKDPQFVERELIKALNYYDANPRKKPKSKRGWTQAANGWLERAWDWRAKNTKGEDPGPAKVIL